MKNKNRKCLQCKYEGSMKLWLTNYSFPQLVGFVALFFWILPGLIFYAWAWGKYKCPYCGSVGKSVLKFNQ